MATVECADGTTFEARCCNEDDGNSCVGDCYDANCAFDTCSCSAVIPTLDDLVERDIVRNAAERSGLTDEQVARAYHTMLESVELRETYRLNAELRGGRIGPLGLAGDEDSFGPTVRVRTDQRTLFDVADADTYGDAYREAELAKRRGDVEIEPVGLVTRLKFALGGLAYSVGRSLGVVPDPAADGTEMA